jgi:hypothetical protein
MLPVPSDPFMASWERKRQPDDVPTPVAVAVSDFCRRAGAPASPRAVREALSASAEADDFRIRIVTDGEPPVRPLGPFAVVDLARGTPADVAGLRERSGYYLLVQELLAAQEGSRGSIAAVSGTETGSPGARTPYEAGSVEPSLPRPRTSGEASSAEPSASGSRTSAEASSVEASARPGSGASSPDTSAPGPRIPTGPLDGAPRSTLAQRIGPRRRAPQPPPTPRGRFTQVESQRAPLEVLAGPVGRAELESLLAQHGHRPAVLRALAQGYSGERGSAPSMPRLDALLAEHGLLEAAEAQERELILSALGEQRGALGRVAWALGLRSPELEELISRLALGPEVERVRERHRREALAAASWATRLDLLGRRKYLVDLGVEREFESRLRGDLARELAALGPQPDGPAALARRLAVPPTLISRALQRLGLSTGGTSSPTLT